MNRGDSVMSWWMDEPLIISAVQCKFEDDDYWTLNEYVVKSGFNTEQLLHLTAKGHMAYYDEEIHGTKLDDYLKQSRKSGIHEIIYYNTHCLTEEIYTKHPDWQQLSKDGKPIPAYTIYTFNCVNGGWFDDFSKNITNLCKHDIDGIFLDGPVMREDGCYCDTCKKIFSDRFGKSIYKASRNELQTMRVDSVTEYIKKTNDIVKGINPQILLYLNNSALRADITGSNSRKVEPYVDMIGAEGGFIRADNKTSLWAVSSKAKHIETVAKGKPTVIFDLGNQSSLAYYMHNSIETKNLYAQTYANGANAWYGMSGSASKFKDSAGCIASIEFNKFINEQKDIYKKSLPCAKVALMWSQDSANNYASGVEQSDFTDAKAAGVKERGDHYTELMSFFDILTRAHTQFDIIDEISVLEGLDKYEIVFLPDCACMSDEVASIITSYVEKGGNICSTFATGFYNADGSYSKTPKIGVVQGVEEVVEVIKYPANGTAYQKLNRCHWLYKGVSADLLPNPLLAVKCKISDNATIVSESLTAMPSVYSALPSKGFPGIVLNKYGKGNSIYITGTFGVCYADRAHIDFAQIVENVVNNYSNYVLKLDTSGLVEAVLRKQEDRYILHLINLTGQMNRPIRRIVPLKDIKIDMQINDIEVPSISIKGGQVTNVNRSEEGISFILTDLIDYDVVVFKKLK